MVEQAVAQERHDFYVYVVFRPSGIPCYVGKGQKDRWKAHLKHTHNQHLARIIAKAGGSVPIAKVRENLTDAEAIETEIALIAVIGRVIDGGPLVNLTLGGDGMSGHIQSAETRAKKREKLLGRKPSPETIAAVKLAWENITPLRRANMSAAQVGHKASDATRLKQKISGLARFGKTLDDVIPKRKTTAAERSLSLAERSIGNQYGLGNKRTPSGQAIVALSVIETNKRRGKSDKPPIHRVTMPWLDDGMSRTSWYRKRAEHKAKPIQGSLDYIAA